MTGTAILVNGLRLLGADVSYHVPNRLEDGYGLNEEAIRKLADSRQENHRVGRLWDHQRRPRTALQRTRRQADHHRSSHDRRPVARCRRDCASETARDRPIRSVNSAGRVSLSNWRGRSANRSAVRKKVTEPLRRYLMQSLSLAGDWHRRRCGAAVGRESDSGRARDSHAARRTASRFGRTDEDHRSWIKYPAWIPRALPSTLHRGSTRPAVSARLNWRSSC